MDAVTEDHVGDTADTPPPPARPGPRERLVDAARELTREQGVTVGVDAILKRADVARRSLYQHFGGKDGLITQVLHTQADADIDRYRTALEEGGTDPRARLLNVFTVLDEITSRPGFRGCFYAAAEAAMTDAGHPGHAETRGYKSRLCDLLAAELRDLGRDDAQALKGASQLVLLIDGILHGGMFSPQTHPAQVAMPLVEMILDGATP